MTPKMMFVTGKIARMRLTTHPRPKYPLDFAIFLPPMGIIYIIFMQISTKMTKIPKKNKKFLKKSVFFVDIVL